MQAAKEQVRNSPGLSFGFRERHEPLSFNWHRHREYELIFVGHGTGTRYIADDVSTFVPGDLVLVGPNVPHAFESSKSEGSHFVIIQFARELFGAGNLGGREFRAIHRLLARAANGLAFDPRTAEIVRPLLEKSNRRTELERLLDLARILDLLAREGRWKVIATDWKGEATGTSKPASRRRLSDILQYVFAHSGAPLSLTGAAAAGGVSVATLCRSFRRELGCTFTEYVARIRISQACSLLIQTNLPVYSISLQVGFENLSNFNRRFRGLKGMTPSEYRGVHRRGATAKLPAGRFASSAGPFRRPAPAGSTPRRSRRVSATE